MNTETQTTETQERDPLFDIDLLGEDAEGNAIAPVDALAKVNKPLLLTWTTGTGANLETRKAELDLSGVSYELWISDDDWRREFMRERGVADNPSEDDEEARERRQKAGREMEGDMEFWRIRASIALAAIKRDKHGLLRTSIMELRQNPTPETMTQKPAFYLWGRKTINAILGELDGFFI